MVTGVTLKRNDCIESNYALWRTDLHPNFRIIVVDGVSKRALIEGWVIDVTKTTIKLRLVNGQQPTATMSEWGIPDEVNSPLDEQQYELNTIFALKSTWWRRHKYRPLQGVG